MDHIYRQIAEDIAKIRLELLGAPPSIPYNRLRSIDTHLENIDRRMANVESLLGRIANATERIARRG